MLTLPTSTIWKCLAPQLNAYARSMRVCTSDQNTTTVRPVPSPSRRAVLSGVVAFLRPALTCSYRSPSELALFVVLAHQTDNL